MRPLSASASCGLARTVCPNFAVVADVENGAENVVKNPIDKDFSEQELATCPFDLQTNTPEEVWLTLSQNEEVHNSRSAVC